MTIKIYGASDDLVELVNVKLGEGGGAFDEDDDPKIWTGTVGGRGAEIDALDSDVQITIGTDEASEGKNAAGIRVWMHYTDLGVWTATILPVEEGVPCPWDIHVSIEGYTAVVEVDAPEGTVVSVVKVEARSL